MNKDVITKMSFQLQTKTEYEAWLSHKFSQTTNSFLWKENSVPNHNTHCFSKIN